MELTGTVWTVEADRQTDFPLRTPDITVGERLGVIAIPESYLNADRSGLSVTWTRVMDELQRSHPVGWHVGGAGVSSSGGLSGALGRALLVDERHQAVVDRDCTWWIAFWDYDLVLMRSSDSHIDALVFAMLAALRKVGAKVELGVGTEHWR